MTDPMTEPERTPRDVANHLAREIKRRRLDAGFSQRGLAAATGYTRQYVSMTEWEDGNLPSQELIAAIDTAVGAEGDLVAIRAEAKTTRQQSRQRSNPVVTEARTDTAGSPVLASTGSGSDRAFDSGSVASLMRSRAVSESSAVSRSSPTSWPASVKASPLML